MLTIIKEESQFITYQDDSGNTVRTHRDGEVLEAEYNGTVYELWGAGYMKYWRKVGKSGRLSKDFIAWMDEVKENLSKKGGK